MNHEKFQIKRVILTFLTFVLCISTTLAEISGTVKDSAGEPLVGVSVIQKGTTRGVVTDVNGLFHINVDEGVTLKFSSIGYNDEELIASSNMVVVMQEGAELIDDVVVVGYSIQSKNAITGSVSTLNSEKLIDVSTANVSTMLQGKISGVQVQQPSGKPGETAKITIRGKSTISSSTAPLWVVDGVIYNDDPRLSPQEIETLTVLKDASATALYGSRGSNGVIVVTTKKGKAGSNTFNVNVNSGVNVLSLGNLDLMNARQLYDYQKPVNGLSWFSENLLTHDTDWFKLITKPAPYVNANVAYTGGRDKISSYFLGDYYYEDAAIKNMSYSRFTLRSNNDYRITDNFSLFSKIQGQYVEYVDQTSSLYDTYLYLPWDYPYNADKSVRTGKEDNWYGRDKSNFLESRDKNFTKYQNIFMQATAGLKWDITSWLSFESNNNVNYKIARDETYTDPNTIGGKATNGKINNHWSWTSNYFLNQMLRFNKMIDKHSISALAAYEYTRRFNQNTSTTAKGITAGKEVITGTTGMDAMSGDKSAFNIQSFLANANYSYDNRYMFQASFRRDGSSKFGKNNQYGNFYTVSGGWNIANEEFFNAGKKIMDQFKLRVSWGVVGNTPDDYYGHLSLYTLGQYNQLPANFPSQLGNPDLTWEKNQTLDIGIDFSFIQRIRGSFDFYNKYTSDLLYKVQLSTLTGYSYQWQNIGAITNLGFEVNLNADIISTKEWLWNVDFNIGVNRNKINELYEGKPQISGIRRFSEGRDMDDLYMAEWAGVNSETGAPQWYTNNSNGERIITEIYSEAEANKAYIGSAAPKFIGGFGTTLQWKGITLNANFNYSYGNKLYSQNREVLDSDGAYLDYNSMNLAKGWNRWEKPGDIATHPKPIAGGNANSNKVSSRYVEDASYLTLRSLSLSYTFPEIILSKIRLKNLTFSFSAENLFTATKYSLISPDVASFSNDGLAAWGQYPITRKFIFGLNVAF